MARHSELRLDPEMILPRVGFAFDGRILTTGDQRDRDTYAQGGGWIIASGFRLYVRSSSDGTRAGQYRWVVQEVGCCD